MFADEIQYLTTKHNYVFQEIGTEVWLVKP